MENRLMFILILLLIPITLSKSYYYDSIFLNLNFYDNGTVLVEQIRDYNFDGSFSWAFIDFKKSGADDVNVIDVIDMRSGNSVPFEVEENPWHTKVKWGYDANNENIKFKIVYLIEGTVRRYRDVSEFYWKLIEEEHERIEYLQADINLPESSHDLFRVFVHTQGTGKDLVFFNQNSSARFMVENIPKNTFVETRILTEPSVFPVVELTDKVKYEDSLEEEKEIFQPGSTIEPVHMILPIILTLIPLTSLVYLYFRYGVEPKVNYQGIYEREPPMDIPPMALVTLLGGPRPIPSPKGLLATLFDFGVRGFLVIKEDEKKFLLFKNIVHTFELTKKGKDSKIKDKLTPFEWEIYRMFFKEISKNGKTVDTGEIRRWTRNNYTLKKRLTDLFKSARKWFEKNHFKIYVRESEKVKKRFVLFVIVYFILSIVMIISGFSSLFWSLYLIPIYFSVLIVVILFSGSISKRTPESTLQVKKWKAFKKFITHFSEMENAPTTLLHIWDRYLVYAVVLGVTDKLLENLKDFSLKTGQNVSGLGWYYGTGGVMKGSISPKQFSVLSNNLSNTIHSMTVTSGAFSTSTSTGGGFSGGGGGGGGGGSSGAG